MRKVYAHKFKFLLTLAICIVSFYWVQGQCLPRSGAYHGELLPNNGCGSFTSSGAYGPGEYFRTPLLNGGSYTFSTCGSGLDTQITGFQGSTTTTNIPGFYNDDFGPDCPSSTRASLTYVSSFTDYVRVNVNQYNCLPGGAQCITVKVRQNNNLNFTSSGTDMCQGGTRTLSATPAPVPSGNAGSGDLGTYAGTGVSGSTFTAPSPAGSSQNISVTYTFGYCTTSQTIEVFSNPSTSNAGSDQTVCTGTTTLSATSPSTGTGTWSVASGPGSVTTPGSASSTVTGLSATTPTTLTWTVTNGPCTASTDNVVITRDADPTTANAGPNQTICGSSTTLAGNAPAVGSGQWTLVGGSGAITTPSSNASGVTGLGTGTNTFRWTISNGTCVNSTDDVVITVDAAPTAANAGAAQDVCGTTATLSGNAASVGTGSWSVVAGSGSVATPGDPNSGVTGLSVGANTFVWSITNGTCPASQDSVTVTRFDPPTAANAGSDFSICGSSATLNANMPSSGTGTWTLIGGSGTFFSANDPATSVTGLGVGPNTFRWTVTSGPCTPTTDDVVVTASAVPSAPSVSGSTMLCSGSTTTLTAVSGPGLSYEWFDAATAGNSVGSGGVFTTAALTTTTSYWVEAQDTLTGCSSNRTQVDVTVNALPADPVSNGDTTVCPDSGIPALSVTVGAGETADWYDAASLGSLLAMGTTSYTPIAGGTYYAEARDTASSCGSSGRTAVTLTVRPDMAATFSFDDTGCPDIVFTDGTTGSPTSWAWNFGDQNTSTSQSPTHTYASNGNYSVQLITTDDCGSDTTLQSIAITCIVGIQEPDVLGTAFTVYPNPNNGTFTVGFDDIRADEISLQVVDLQGRIVLTRELSGVVGGFQTDINLNGHSNGIYFVKVYADGKTATKKVIVQ